MKSMITQLFKRAGWKLSLLLPLLALCLTGCGTPDYSGVMQAPGADDPGIASAARLHVGDSITVSFDGPPEPIAAHEEVIKEDGYITLEYIGSIKAAGKTAGELQNDITTNYVPKYYTHLNVTVKIGDRVFYVRGEVKNPGRQIYVGQITVTKAITSAGDFTDFANANKVWLTRANGQRYKIDCEAILDGKAPDPGVYPGDQIDVSRRRL